MLYHPLMSKYAMRHHAAGHRLLPHDIVISCLCHFLWEDGTGGEDGSWFLSPWDSFSGFSIFSTPEGS